MTLLDVLEQNNWNFAISRLTPSDSTRITTAMTQPVINITFDFKAKRRRQPLKFDVYVGSETDVVFWGSPSRVILKNSRAFLFTDFKQFIWIVGRFALHPRLKLSPDEWLLVEGGLRAAYAKAVARVPSPKAEVSLKDFSTSLELV